MDGEEEEEDDAEDGPENLCIKNTMNNNNSESLSNNNSSANNIGKNNNGSSISSTGNGCGSGSTSSSNRIGLSLKDIRHLNRPPSHCRQNPFPAAAAAAHIDYAVAAAAAHQHHFEQQHREQQRELQREHREREREREREHRERENERESSEHRGDASSAAANAQYLQQQADNLMKREALETRLENESPYMDRNLCNFFQLHKLQSEIEQNPSDVNRSQQDQPPSSQQQQQQQPPPHSVGNAHHPNSRHHDIDSNLHKDFTPSSPMSLPSHFNAREGPPHPPSPLQFPGMSSALTLTPPHHSKYIYFYQI